MRTSTLERDRRVAEGEGGGTKPLGRDWAEILTDPNCPPLLNALQQWLPSRRWFRSKARNIESIHIREKIPVPMRWREKAFLLLFDVKYAEGEPETYVLPLACAFGKKAEEIERAWPQLLLARVALTRPRRTGALYDAIVSKEFCRALLDLTSRERTVKGNEGELEAEPTRVLKRIRHDEGLDIEAKVGKAEQSNSSVVYGSRLILKFFRRLDPGINPELEIERFLAARDFPYSPPLAGALEYHDHSGKNSTVAVMTSFVAGCHDEWEDTLAALNRFYKKVQTLPAELRLAPPAAETTGSIFDRSGSARKPADLIGAYLPDAKTLGNRTAALHLALASDDRDQAFKPEPWTTDAQKALFDSLREMTERNFGLLERRMEGVPADLQKQAQTVLELKPKIVERIEAASRQSLEGTRIRTHGDYHLGQVLHHGSDFLIIDFEGEPAIPLEARREKQSALRDVAGMIFSFFYASNAALRDLPENGFGQAPQETRAAWARYWSVWVSSAFLRAYLEKAGGAAFLPRDESGLKTLLDIELLRKAVYELGYELNNRPEWLQIAFQIIIDLLNPDNPI
jgi:maltose alpha-D-glucosyltransferase/alpha-amylase